LRVGRLRNRRDDGRHRSAATVRGGQVLEPDSANRGDRTVDRCNHRGNAGDPDRRTGIVLRCGSGERSRADVIGSGRDRRPSLGRAAAGNAENTVSKQRPDLSNVAEGEIFLTRMPAVGLERGFEIVVDDQNRAGSVRPRVKGSYERPVDARLRAILNEADAAGENCV